MKFITIVILIFIIALLAAMIPQTMFVKFVEHEKMVASEKEVAEAQKARETNDRLRAQGLIK
jgi:type II secretory pathway pseudopilin PulG